MRQAPGRKKYVVIPRVEKYLSDFRCPGCHGSPLSVDSSHMVCPACNTQYAVTRGVPRLLNDDSASHASKELGTTTGNAMVEEYAGSGPTTRPGWRQRLVNLLRPPEVLLHTNPDLQAAHTRALFEQAGETTRVLNVGGGPHRYSGHELTMNIEAFHNVDMVGDAHNIPFADNTFDAIFSVAVLEHVYDPEKVVSEMIRVLKPGGILYSEVPFIFFFHGYPNDFRRYTREGMRRLFGALEGVEIGMTSGPMSAMLQSSNLALQMLVPPKPGFLRKAFNGVFRWLVFWLKYLDRPLIAHNPDAHVLAAGFYALGKKPAQSADARSPR